ESARKEPLFVANNAGGPFAARIAAEPAFAAEVEALAPDEYERIVRSYDDQIWGHLPPFMSVEESFPASCQLPFLLIPGNDPFHPFPVSERLCREMPNAECLAVDARSPENIEATKRRLRDFFREHSR